MVDDVGIVDQLNYEIGNSHDELHIDSSEDNHKFALKLVTQARHSVDIFTQDLAARIYDESKFITALRELALRNKHAMVRVLVINPERTIKQGHRIIELARRLTSSIELRHVPEDFRSDPQSYLLADVRGVLHRNDASRYEATVDFNAPLRGRELANHFNGIWEHSPLVLEFKRLYI